MKTQQKNPSIKKRVFINRRHLTEIIFMLVAIVSPSVSTLYTVGVSAAAQTEQTYCAQFNSNDDQKNACQDGWKGTDCTFYLQSHGNNAEGEKLVSICQAATKAKDANPTSVDTGTDKPKTDKDTDKDTDTKPGNTNSSNSGSSDTLQQMIDQIDALQKLKGETDGADADKVADNKYESYVNGAGKQQPIQVSGTHEGAPRPAIIFFNGGGWHADDGVGQKVAPKANERGYATFVASYRLGSSGVYYMFDDVMRAIRHVRNNAPMYNIDPNRIAIWGDSAGGSLAIRASSSGKTGAAGAVGWSAPTNAYTAIFRSVQSFAIGMDHSTCVPTDLNGVANILDQLNGGEGDTPYDGGLGDNSTSNGDGTVLGTVSDVLTLAQTAQKAGKSVQALAKQSDSSGGSTDKSSSDSSSSDSGSGGDLEQNVRRLTTSKLLECLDNFNSASPALFASPLSPPTFLAGFDHDPLVGPDQAYQMRDKLRSLGIPSSTLILPGVVGDVQPGKNHLDYGEEFVAPSLDFLDKFLHPPNAPQQ
jgi:acetyl esterase/lipase